MRRIAIVGSGQAGLLAAHGLVKSGYQVTLYSDRTPEQWLKESRPTGTAVRFDLALQFERELGLNYWDDKVRWGEGGHITLAPVPKKPLLTLAGRMPKPFQGVDLRLQSHRWMHELVARGGRIEIESVNVERLDQIAAEHDLTVVAAGRAELSRLFERDAERSVYDKPQRHLAMLCVKGLALDFKGLHLLPVKYNIIGMLGESFWIPYYHKDVGPSWGILIEAKPGSPLDRFEGCTSGEQTLEIFKKVVREFTPWEYDWIKDAELSDPLGWLVGKFAPTVRKPVGRLPSGRLVTALGDTAVAMDPIAGQGANSGNKMARNLVESIIAHAERPFDAQWMTDTFERFWVRHGGPTYSLSSLLLDPPTPEMQKLLFAQNGSDGRADNDSVQQRLANAFVENVVDPGLLTHVVRDKRKLHELIEQVTGRSWMRAVAGGAMSAGWQALRQWTGLSSSDSASVSTRAA
jgi:2-polyprenyl-6-methoxyphenol hydroxylase-like FAD-dependent oxidoreductase